ncbi:endoribonuclease ZC3H12A [Phyllopteryx taeniolatus]|uniref:endoribonuclease ZC3H12A n=1 Tax=Phyllopteryx taeniolatus TaxID=161469 RepID=UPI002AD25D72|nr:endoribonuclease ZC3H12A [Phyllopteryx taeniolatus]XP_061633132.1 endoribonuclease ZC3H12A [Phyllopteryx taeniolatus]XP_061633133.1 endoribonuclease ZC3H12A [Phyllopteryx taeniolatus]XP_061633134.1 endoribonuclease ZC3H12A [Phyllopteryx taeniolatus]XP_061633135.1 endoribonuclease ZC3H12A [Phyllopteryx taeniolatus]
MDPTFSNLNPSSPESLELQLRVDFFRKLGYSMGEVNAALSKLGLSTDNNSMLEELVQISSVALGSSGGEQEERSAHPKEDSNRVSRPLRNLTQLEGKKSEDSELRPIVIDGSNVAMSHGNKEVFSCRGIQLAVNFFLQRGHTAITVFVPSWRKEQSRPNAGIKDKHILMELEKQKRVVFTPSRRVGGKLVVCYDDRFIVKLAYDSGGVIVSNDTYRDLQEERLEWKKCIEERLLMYSFVNDKFMPPDDPLGRHGPNLDNFLRTKPLSKEQMRQLCPYDKKCTYGIKCKFYHPERANQSYLSLADELREKAQISPAKESVRLSHGPSQSMPYIRPQELDMLDHQWSSHPDQVCQNKVLYWEGPNPASASGHQECSGPNHYHSSAPQEYLDSGLGSYESQYSDVCFRNSHRLATQLQSAGPKQSCGCSRNLDSASPFMFPAGAAQNHSVPSPFSGAPHCRGNYWSDPFHRPPQAGRCSPLPGAVHPSHQDSFCCSCSGQQYPFWLQKQFDGQRLQLRKKLQAIFSPQQVDTVMDMFPHVINAEKLAAEILNLKAQNRIFL